MCSEDISPTLISCSTWVWSVPEILRNAISKIQHDFPFSTEHCLKCFEFKQKFNGFEVSDKRNQNFSLVCKFQVRRLYPWAAGVVPYCHILILQSLLKHKSKKKKQQAKKKIIIWFFSLNSLQGDRPKNKSKFLLNLWEICYSSESLVI